MRVFFKIILSRSDIAAPMFRTKENHDLGNDFQVLYLRTFDFDIYLKIEIFCHSRHRSNDIIARRKNFGLSPPPYFCGI